MPFIKRERKKVSVEEGDKISERKKTCNLINFEQCHRVLLEIRILERSSKKHPLLKESSSKYRGF